MSTADQVAVRNFVALLRRSGLATAELAAALPGTGWTARRAGTLVLVTENQPTLLEVIGRHLHRHAVSCQGLDAVLLHLAGGIGNDLVSGVELHAVAGIGEDFGDQSFELDQLLLSHEFLQVVDG